MSGAIFSPNHAWPILESLEHLIAAPAARMSPASHVGGLSTHVATMRLFLKIFEPNRGAKTTGQVQ